MREITAAAPDHSDMPLGLRFYEQHPLDRTMTALFSDHPRQKGDTQPSRYQFDNEVDLAASPRDRRLKFVTSAGIWVRLD